MLALGSQLAFNSGESITHVGSCDLRVTPQWCWHWGFSRQSTVGKVLKYTRGESWLAGGFPGMLTLGSQLAFNSGESITHMEGLMSCGWLHNDADTGESVSCQHRGTYYTWGESWLVVDSTVMLTLGSQSAVNNWEVLHMQGVMNCG